MVPVSLASDVTLMRGEVRVPEVLDTALEDQVSVVMPVPAVVRARGLVQWVRVMDRVHLDSVNLEAEPNLGKCCDVRVDHPVAWLPGGQPPPSRRCGHAVMLFFLLGYAPAMTRFLPVFFAS